MDAAHAVSLCHTKDTNLGDSRFNNGLNLCPRGKHSHYYPGQQSNLPSALELGPLSSRSGVCYTDILEKIVQDKNRHASPLRRPAEMREARGELSPNTGTEIIVASNAS